MPQQNPAPREVPVIPSISVCMIVKNEEAVLARCLDCVKLFADEVIVVDTGSTDGTMGIASSYTEHVHQFLWCDDFSAARNYSYSLATGDYIMWLDADNVIEKPDCERINTLKQRLSPDTEVVFMLRRAERADNDETLLLRDRMILRSLGARWEYAVHEAIPMYALKEDGQLRPYRRYIADDITVWHKKEVVNDPGRNLRILEKMREAGSSFTAFNQAYYCRELYLAGRYDDAVASYHLARAAGSPFIATHALPFGVWSLQKLGQWQEALAVLTEALALVSLSPLICCEMGHSFFHLEKYEQAEFWYLQALHFSMDLSDFVMVFPAYYGFIPCQRLTRLYARTGQIEKAVEYNERAASYRPDSPSVVLNRIYFESLGRL